MKKIIKREKEIKEREGKNGEEMLSAMKGSYFKLIAAKRVYSENQFYESPLSTKGSSMQPSNLKLNVQNDGIGSDSCWIS